MVQSLLLIAAVRLQQGEQEGPTRVVRRQEQAALEAGFRIRLVLAEGRGVVEQRAVAQIAQQDPGAGAAGFLARGLFRELHRLVQALILEPPGPCLHEVPEDRRGGGEEVHPRGLNLSRKGPQEGVEGPGRCQRGGLVGLPGHRDARGQLLAPGMAIAEVQVLADAAEVQLDQQGPGLSADRGQVCRQLGQAGDREATVKLQLVLDQCDHGPALGGFQAGAFGGHRADEHDLQARACPLPGQQPGQPTPGQKEQGESGAQPEVGARGSGGQHCHGSQLRARSVPA